ncbi:MAG: hypothetical protein ACJ711_06800 [Ornithinibacter sp.]
MAITVIPDVYRTGCPRRQGGCRLRPSPVRRNLALDAAGRPVTEMAQGPQTARVRTARRLPARPTGRPGW